jgi:hypothetical protein
MWNQLASAYDFQLLCGYAVGHFYKKSSDAVDMEDIRRQHSHVHPA